MNTTELAKKVAEASGLPVARAENILRFAFAEIVKAVAAGDTVKVYNFGYFSYNEHKERPGHNPQSGEAIVIQAQKVAHWSVSIAIKEVLKGTRSIDTLFEGIDPKVDQPRGPAPKEITAVVADPAVPTGPVVPPAPVAEQATKKGKSKKVEATTPAAPAAPAVPDTGMVPPPPPV